jgi:hypothetical protein
MSMVATFAVLSGFRSLCVSSVVITTRFIVSIAAAVPAVLSRGIAVVWAIILMAPLVGPMAISVLFLAVALVGTSVLFTTTGGPGLGVLVGLLLAFH